MVRHMVGLFGRHDPGLPRRPRGYRRGADHRRGWRGTGHRLPGLLPRVQRLRAHAGRPATERLVRVHSPTTLRRPGTRRREAGNGIPHAAVLRVAQAPRPRGPVHGRGWGRAALDRAESRGLLRVERLRVPPAVPGRGEPAARVVRLHRVGGGGWLREPSLPP